MVEQQIHCQYISSSHGKIASYDLGKQSFSHENNLPTCKYKNVYIDSP